MKDYRNELFEIIYENIRSKRKRIFLYFIHNYDYMKGELKITNRPLIYIDNEIQKVFNSIQKKDLRFNQVTTAIFGPHFHPERSAQSYNVYAKLYFDKNEVKELIDTNKLESFEHIKINNHVFYTIDAIAKSLSKDFNENENNSKTKPEKHTKEIETDEIDEFAKIKSIKLSNFLNINDINIEFSPGINLIIGENNIGKTGFVKFLYANSKAYEEYGKTKGTSNERSFKERLSIKTQKTFQSDEKIGAIVNKSSDKELISHLVFSTNDIEDKYINMSFKKSTKTEIANVDFTEIYSKNSLYKYNAVFIPAKEILSISNAIKVALNYPTDGFDATYEDLLKDIEPLFAKKSEKNILNKIAKKIESEIIEGEIEYNKSKSKYFYKDKDGHRFDLTMSAEGIKQLGIIPLLINTGKITEGTILFLDEPDNNLNPVAIFHNIFHYIMNTKKLLKI
ncbi:MAG: hypothetical protein B6I24_04155 [Bacteroidetes bacterium 4572_128]|nr:MAG: hypothetical protein B6I24_04155 [Bacteroidetes bacterium 4572_128]